ncbi:MAG: AAA family ATPase [Deltaproteobacteria bacterium]|nr:AAA family ATPase [Deltaproteobacteria bacterium]
MSTAPRIATHALTALLGRDHELAELADELAQGARWLTLVGLGGVGKSRLARKVAERFVADSASRIGRVIVCSGAAAASIGELLMALGERVASVTRGQAAPAGSALARDVVERLVGLGGGPIVIVLDDLEHLLDSGTSGSALAELALELLTALPSLTLLATSRVALEHPAERVYPVPPLACDGPESPAVALLLDRARGPRIHPAWRDDRAALTRLARRLDGVPLALELAAARAQLITPAELEGLLDDRFSLAQPRHDPRQASRDGAIAWAWAHLTTAEQAALGRLAVIAGTFDLELALALVPANRADAFATLEQLARYSRVTPEVATSAYVDLDRIGDAAPRYRILQSVREFATERLTPAQREAALTTMAETVFDRFAEHLTPFGHLDTDTLRRAASERDRLLQLLHAGLATPTDAAAVARALRAARILLAMFRRTGFELPLVVLVRELFDLPTSTETPVEVQLAVGLFVLSVLANSDDSDAVDRLGARLEVLAGQDPLRRAAVITARSVVLHYRWDYRALAAQIGTIASEPAVANEPGLHALALEYQLLAARALGRAAPDDDAQLAGAIDALDEARLFDHAIRCRVNRAFLATHAGRPELALAQLRSARAIDAVEPVARYEPYVAREEARAEMELGRRAVALAHFDHALARFDEGASTQVAETLLDRAATALEAGEIDQALSNLARVRPRTSFARAYSEALARAAAALVGPVLGLETAAALPTTDTVEDEALRLWALLPELRRVGLGLADMSALADRLMSPAAPASFRVRQAQRVARAAFGLATHAPDVLGIARDFSGYRLGATWNELSTTPLLRRLLEVVATPALRGSPH